MQNIRNREHITRNKHCRSKNWLQMQLANTSCFQIAKSHHKNPLQSEFCQSQLISDDYTSQTELKSLSLHWKHNTPCKESWCQEEKSTSKCNFFSTGTNLKFILFVWINMNKSITQLKTHCGQLEKSIFMCLSVGILPCYWTGILQLIACEHIGDQRYCKLLVDPHLVAAKR